jgi:hypothetical protein
MHKALEHKQFKVLQVYALTGLGHLREATSIKNAMDESGIENSTLDILTWAEKHSLYSRLAVIPLKISKNFFEFTTRNTSAFNAIRVPAFAQKLVLDIFRLAEVPLGFALRRYLTNSEYDVFIAVHPWGLGALWSFGLGRHLCQRLVNVIPDEIDFGSASFYGIPGGKTGPLHLVNSQRVKELFIQVGVDPDRIKIIGHTLDPFIFRQRNKIFNRVQNKLMSQEALTLGLYIGGTGTIDEKVRIRKIITELAGYLHIGTYKIKIIPGPHIEFAAELHELAQKLNLPDSHNLEIYSNSDRNEVIRVGHKWLAEDVDVLFAKTGEIVFYSLATGIPHIHFPPKGSNEVEHVLLMEKLNAIYDFDKIRDLHQFLQDRNFLKKLSSAEFNSGYKLDGSYEVVKYLEQVAISEKLPLSLKHRLVRLFRRK